MIKVVLFEDNKSLRESIAEMLSISDDFNCAGEYADCRNVVQVIGRIAPDVVLMDIDLPVVSGIEGTRLIHQHYPAVKILMLTVFEENDKIFNAICAGASGYLLKKTAPEKILEAIREVKEGGAPMTPSIAGKVLHMFQNQNGTAAAKELFTLSEKEKNVLSALVKGMSYKMIAAEFSVSINTVNFHIKNIYEKLHVHSVSEAVSKAIKNKIV